MMCKDSAGFYSGRKQNVRKEFRFSIKKTAAFCVLLFVFGACAFAETDIETLLKGYFSNSLDLLELSNDVADKKLQKKADSIQNGFDITVSTGTVTVTAGSSIDFSMTPAVSVSVPQADNLKFAVSTDVQGPAAADESVFSNTRLKLSADVFSGSMAERKIALEKSERKLLEAERSLLNGFLSVENEFYDNLKKLYEIASKIVTAKKSLYEDQLDFEQIKAQGYSTASTKYRLSQMEVLTDQRNVETYERELERETRIFAAKCGIQYEQGTALDFLPKEIPSVEPVDVFSFNKDDYVKTENAVWTNYINQKSRDADRSFSLSANAGYTFNKEIKSSYSDTVDAGASFTWNGTGLTANAGVSFPLNSMEPVYEFGISFVPNKFRLYPLTKEQKEIAAGQEQLAIESAKIDYTTSVITQKTQLDDILWNREANKESYDMYTSLEKDLANYFARGIITESEYLSAQVNRENYRIKCLINDIELIIYNNKTKQLFTRDQEILCQF